MNFPKVAVIGLGFMGRTHIQSLRRLGVEVYGVAGITPDEAKKAAEELGIPRGTRILKKQSQIRKSRLCIFAHQITCTFRRRKKPWKAASMCCAKNPWL